MTGNVKGSSLGRGSLSSPGSHNTLLTSNPAACDSGPALNKPAQIARGQFLQSMLHTIYIHNVGEGSNRIISMETDLGSLQQFPTRISENPPAAAIDLHSNSWRFRRNPRLEWTEGVEGKSHPHSVVTKRRWMKQKKFGDTNVLIFY